jgi:thiamine kinase-like enzyme
MAQRHVTELARLERILARLEPSLGPLVGEPVALSGGITNHNFHVTLGEDDYVIRLHGKDTELLGIDRDAERMACQLAAELGIAPQLVSTLEDCLVTSFVPCDRVRPRDVADHATELARALRSFHDSPTVLPVRFWVPDLLTDYAASVHQRGVGLPAGYAEAASVAARIAVALPLEHPRPCHNDLLTGNLISPHHGDAKMLIVDWEYAGMGDPCFDLGNLSVNNDFDEADDARLLSAYYGEPPSDGRRAILALMRIMSDAREAAWGVMQAEVSELEFDFGRYARVHFERLRTAAEQPLLREWLDAATREREEQRGQTT